MAGARSVFRPIPYERNMVRLCRRQRAAARCFDDVRWLWSEIDGKIGFVDRRADSTTCESGVQDAMSDDHTSPRVLPAPGHSAPTPPDVRFEIIDIIRGFALFGVLVGNIVWTSQYFAVTDGQRDALPSAAIDRIVNCFTVMLVDYKFFTLFSMLFGLGFALQLGRAAETGRNLVGVYSRRLLILFLLGVSHAVFLWFGDILHTYALVGFVLILFRSRSDREILGCALFIAVFVSLLPLLHWAIAGSATSEASADVEITEMRFAAITGSNWWDVIRANGNYLRNEYSHVNLKFDGIGYWYLSVFWKFLLGFYIGRRLLLQQAERHLELYQRILPWAWVIGLTGNAVLSLANLLLGIWIPEHPSALAALIWIPLDLSLFALSVAYLATLVLLYQRPRWQRMLRPLAPIGRMALTNYLSQSMFMVILFYGVGFNLLGKTGTGVCLVFSIIIFGFQITVSSWWLKRFRFGPAEWMWRCLTYGRWQPMRAMPRSAHSGKGS